MLTNLVENAIKYARQDGGTVKVETGLENRKGQNGGFMRVEDNGPGIPAGHLPHLFERFYRVDQARSRDEKGEDSSATGSGLGLAISQSIAQLMGGTIEVQSQPGQGSIFSVWLPRSSA
jgi:signal transduction histidine kinase